MYVIICMYVSVLFSGLQPVPDHTVIEQYGGKHVSLDNLSNYYGSVSGIILALLVWIIEIGTRVCCVIEVVMRQL